MISRILPLIRIAVEHIQADVALVGAGVMGATLATLLHHLEPGFDVLVLEGLDAVAQESSAALNNAGTGHAANCELNYTPPGADGRLDLRKALAINGAFEQSLQFWAALVDSDVLPPPADLPFLQPVPHCSVVWGESDAAFLAERQRQMAMLPQFEGMAFSRDPAVLRDWLPLMMRGRHNNEPMAATRYGRGTDVDFGCLTRALFAWLVRYGAVELRLGCNVQNVQREADGTWLLTARHNSRLLKVRSRFVFLGAGGGTLPLLQRTGLKEARGYGGFPVSGQWLVCDARDLVQGHRAKAYGKASVGAPPMSVPHLDSRWVEGRRALLFGPFAGFSGKFLKRGSLLDWPASVRLHNLLPMVTVGAQQFHLVRYLVGQLRLGTAERLATLQRFLPTAQAQDWQLEVAGQRVQIIKQEPGRGPQLKLGTEVVTAADGSLAALLGASPGASTAVAIMEQLLQRCFPQRFRDEGWQHRLRQLVPYDPQNPGPDLAATLRRCRQRCDAVLGLTDHDAAGPTC